MKVNSRTDVDKIVKPIGKEIPKLYKFIYDCIQVWEWIQGIQTNRSCHLYSSQENRIQPQGITALKTNYPEVESYIRGIYKKILIISLTVNF